jgi:bacteriocin-like protein
MNNDIRELDADELAAVSGGMKTDPNYVSKNVIDARGGSLTVWGVTFTYDIHGKMSSIS